jgi:glycosyltransferase involved in cell wall biosynthesis
MYDRGNQSVVVEMGVSEDFFLGESKLKNRHLSICFLGKGKSNGNSNGIEEFVSQISKIDFQKRITLGFIGLGDTNLETYILSMLADNSKIQVHIETHVSHNLVPRIVSNYQVGLVPYPETDYHSDRFPIKILEYAALGLNILITDSKLHRSIVPEECAFFFDPRDEKSLELAIRELMDKGLSLKRRNNANLWARSHTYESRAKKYVNIAS